MICNKTNSKYKYIKALRALMSYAMFRHEGETKTKQSLFETRPSTVDDDITLDTFSFSHFTYFTTISQQ